MKAFFTDEQLLHDPQQFMRLGRISKPADLPTRAHALRDALAARDIELVQPRDYGRAPLEGVHSADYLDYLETAYALWRALKLPGVEPGIEVLPNLSPYHGGTPGVPRAPCPSPSIVARTGYYISDLSCPIGPHTWRSVLRSAHTAVAAADAVLDSGDAAYALCRPSGHHAHRDRAGGFCYVNNSAAAAQRLRERHGRVAVLDLDAHHGDGTQNIFYARDDVLTVSTHADPSGYYPFYTGYAHERGSGAGEGCNLNLPLPHGAGNELFLQAVDQGLAALRGFAPKALVLALGFDSYKDDPISVLRLDLDAYRRIGEKIGALGLPTVIVQEGGYMVEAIGSALDHFLRGFEALR
ncbi:histone deacetylase family protein [Variovorax sp. LjRoot130]|uniref:histone deacetylase family protein n=1 Tax=Variovorax sp. LjRoot130 TaxID=3342261 RepID=UPI003ECD127C